MFFRFLILIHVCVAFPLKCPKPAQWSIRARSHCPDPSKYFCLKNDLINGYSENCTVFDFLQPGRKHVLRGGLDADVCSSKRYQPWPITFYSNASTNCIFLKSRCNEEGQIVYDEGSRNMDNTCVCDYTSGYDFLVKPRHPCFCVPSEEDCSCYLKTCPDSSVNLAPDYECSESRINTLKKQCRPVMNGSVNKDHNQTRIQYIPRQDNTSNSITWKKIGGISVFVVCIGMILVFFIPKYHWKETICQCQTEKKSPVSLLEEDNKVTNKINNSKMETSGYLYKETISRSSLSDDGKSSINKYGIDSESCADVKVYLDETSQSHLTTLQQMLKDKTINGEKRCPLKIVMMHNQDGSGDEEIVNTLNSYVDKVNQKLDIHGIGIQLICAILGSIVLYVDILVEKMETDEKFNFVLYSYMQIIIQTGVIDVSSAGYVDVALIFHEALCDHGAQVVTDAKQFLGLRRCSNCENMAVYKCYDCNIRLCKECSRKHNDENKYQRHVMQYISDSFILNCKFSVEDDLPGESFIRDIKCLPNGMVIVAVYRPLSTVLVCSISGEQRQIKQLKSHPQKMDVMDKTTVAVLLENNSMAIIDTQQFIVQYIRHNDTCRNVRSSFICIEKLFYFADKIGIKVVDSSGTEQRGIKLSFTPYDMCYDVHSQRIYCIDYDNRKLTCIDRDGNIIFTFSDTNVKNLHRITIDNDGNVLVLCIKRGDSLDCVIKVNSNGKLSEVVITNIAMPDMFSCIGFHHLTNSVVIGVDTDVYIYKEDKKSLNIG